MKPTVKYALKADGGYLNLDCSVMSGVQTRLPLEDAKLYPSHAAVLNDVLGRSKSAVERGGFVTARIVAIEVFEGRREVRA